jgi:hypothetical protein
MIADGIERRARRIWVPGWVRTLHWLRALLHTPWAERELLRAAPEMEALYVEGLAADGALASSFGPRERQREATRAAHAHDRKPARLAQDPASDMASPAM